MKNIFAHNNYVKAHLAVNSLTPENLALRWAIPVDGGVVFGLLSSRSTDTTIEFVAVNGKVAFRADERHDQIFVCGGKSWKFVPVPSKETITIGALIKPRGLKQVSIMRLRVVKGQRLPIGYMNPEMVPESLKKGLGIHNIKVTRNPVTTVIAKKVSKEPVIQEVQPAAKVQPAESILSFRFTRMRSRIRRGNPAPRRKPLNTGKPLAVDTAWLKQAMTRFPRHKRKTQDLPETLESQLLGVCWS